MRTANPRSSEAAGRGAWLTLAVVAGGLFLAVMSTTLVSVALPTIGRDLHASATDLQWIVDAYVLVYASLLVAGGVIGDRRGRKGVFMLGVALFGAGSLLTGLASSIGVLLIGRVLQGVLDQRPARRRAARTGRTICSAACINPGAQPL